MSVAEIRPGAIISRALHIYRDQALTLLGAALVIFAIQFLLLLLLPKLPFIAGAAAFVLSVFYGGMVVNLVRDVQDGRRDHSMGELFSAVAPVALPLIGLVSLLMRSNLDPSWDDPELHSMLFLVVGATASGLAYAAGDAAERRGDARVLLLSLAFLAYRRLPPTAVVEHVPGLRVKGKDTAVDAYVLRDLWTAGGTDIVGAGRTGGRLRTRGAVA